MPAAVLAPWALGLVLASLGGGPDAGAGTPVEVMVVAEPEPVEALVKVLAPRLQAAGYGARFRRCEDFSCTHEPRPGDDPAVVIVPGSAKALVIVMHDDPRHVAVREIALPHTTLDAEAFGATVLSDLDAPPAHRMMSWAAVEQMGRQRAPEFVSTPDLEPADPTPTERPSPSFGRGAYLMVAGGSNGPAGFGMPIGLVSALSGGFMFAPSGSRFRAAVGGRLRNTNALRDGAGLAAGEARLSLGGARPRLLTMAHVGVGPGLAYAGRLDAPWMQGAMSLAGSLRGRVTEAVSVGIEAGLAFNLPLGDLQTYALFSATWTWDIPKRGEGAR